MAILQIGILVADWIHHHLCKYYWPVYKDGMTCQGLTWNKLYLFDSLDSENPFRIVRCLEWCSLCVHLSS